MYFARGGKSSVAVGLVPFPAVAVDVKGPVIGILDGNTIEVLHNNRAKHIRLNDIDCTEKGQA